MKHPLKTTIYLLLLFLFIEFFGLIVINKALLESQIIDKIIGPAPSLSAYDTLWLIITSIILGTIFVLILSYFKQRRLWQLWFFLAVGISISITLFIFIKNELVAYIIGFLLAFFKVFKKKFHNFTEFLIYPGITLFFFKLLNIKIMMLLLIIISIYDIIAVRITKHMVSLAKFQLSSSFAGISLLKEKNIKINEKKDLLRKKNSFYNQFVDKLNFKLNKKNLFLKNNKKKVNLNFFSKNLNKKIAILGGGDIEFPLLFCAVLMRELFMKNFSNYFLLTLIPLFGAFLFLALLLFFSKEKKFYPAMPFITTGLLIGYYMMFFFI